MGQIEFPRWMLYYLAFAFFMSAFANIFSIVVRFEVIGFGRSTPSLPITPHSAALEYLGAESDPFHSADEWETLYPPGKGFVRLDGSYYLISMYHQMHCVNSFRRSIEDYRAGLNTTALRMMHLTHCLSYLRQSILCNADISLELTSLRRTVNGETVHAAYGGGVTHECRDWSEVYGWLAKNHQEWKNDDNFEVL